MRMFTFLAAATAVGGIAAPLSAQSAYQYQSYPVQQTYPQQYPQQVPQPYPGQPGYGYNQGYNSGYGGQSGIAQIIGQLLGNRYTVNDRSAVSQCASAAMVQAQAEYRGNGYTRYGEGFGDNRGYGYNGSGYQQRYAAPAMRVTAITSVERRNSGLRVRGLMSSGYGGYGGQRGQYDYQDQRYAQGDLSFRCNVAYNGQVTNVRISRNDNYRRY